MTAGIRAGSSNDGFLQANGVDIVRFESNGKLTLPGPVLANVPALRVCKTVDQALTNATITVVQFNSVELDSSSAWNGSTFRWTPQLSGWYQVTGRIRATPASNNIIDFVGSVNKNGVSELEGNSVRFSSGWASAVGSVAAGLVFLNGTTDYIDFRTYVEVSPAAVPTVAGLRSHTYLSAFFVRA